MIKHIQFYGASWCGDCVRAKSFLDSHKIPYEYIDVDFVASAAKKVEEINQGKRIIPTLILDDVPLTNPSNQKLSTALGLTLDHGEMQIREGAGCRLDDPDAC